MRLRTTYIHKKDFHEKDVIALSGVLGIHPNLQDPSINLTIRFNWEEEDEIHIIITSTCIKQLYVIIKPLQNLIYNECLVSSGLEKGIAYKWVKSQVEFASLYDFDILEAISYRNKKDTQTNWIGYLLWARFGYLMQEKTLTDFRAKLKNDGRNEEDILTLLSTLDGQIYWKKVGESWYGEFLIYPKNSESHQILGQYKSSGVI